MTNATEEKKLSPAIYSQLVEWALAEDLGGTVHLQNDITSAWTLNADNRASARIIARQQGVLAGIDVARATFARLDPELSFIALAADGDSVEKEQVLLRLEGSAHALLTGERTALNFLQRLSGVSTLTRRYVNAVEGTKARITDTRKTTPGWRHLQKWAVLVGGGVNHRMGLYDAVLIKENHAAACGGVDAAMQRARRQAAASGREVALFVEAETLEQVESLLPLAPDRIMLDNMTDETMREAVALIRSANGEIAIEATGGYTLATVASAAATGVDLISLGALTHSAPALDLSMLFDE
ncbi:MAG: nicotinate-nucleotide pyrophosphorylase (carboxylating) [Candidatus Latescibacterota bacterium]|jgi:nicotinate-nucleotide pyrophosphorylase (carboxylating)